MRKPIYLVRHGQIYRDGNFDTLNEEGLQFASDLPGRLDFCKIDFISSVKGKNRCHETIRNIKKVDVKFEEYDKIDFYYLKPYFAALNYCISVICYGKEEIVEIFKIFNIEINEENNKSFYGKIIKISIDENFNY
ncbi:MAG: hypothetical protein ACI9OE_001933 [Mariniflexile sp.]|jgi:hypothetical protein